MSNTLKLWWMHQKREKSNEKYSRLIDQASGDEREFLIHEAMNVRDEEDDQILNLESISLLQKAKYLSVPIPPSDDNISWERGQSPRTRRLTVYAQSELRHAISSEKIDKWRVAAFRLKELALPIIAVLGAIWGALRGISALRSK